MITTIEGCVPKIDEIVEFGPFRLHVTARLLQRKGAAVKIGSRSLDLLIALVERPGEVLSRRELMARAWAGLVVDEANLRVNIASLRKCLGEGKEGTRYIVNLPGRGYSFVAPLTRARVEASPGQSETSRSSLRQSATRIGLRTLIARTSRTAHWARCFSSRSGRDAHQTSIREHHRSGWNG
jgi:DNA-binding winged helix-turn-helix (wHTH) protein